jgi:hypothetical protein
MNTTIPIHPLYSRYQLSLLKAQNGGQIEALSDSVSQENLSDENFTNLMKATASIVS